MMAPQENTVILKTHRELVCNLKQKIPLFSQNNETCVDLLSIATYESQVLIFSRETLHDATQRDQPSLVFFLLTDKSN